MADTPKPGGISPGRRIRIAQGAFENYEGTVQSVEQDTGIVIVVMNVFGRVTLVEVGITEIEPVD